IPPFFFIIDEINRAELSRVFGELMYCLEYRGVKGSVKTQYANLNTKKTGILELGQTYQFFIPTNIYLIGTMNTIDRSVESFDFALR
ncbi:AAA family ATPase, partial [Acinetobacter baumannii]